MEEHPGFFKKPVLLKILALLISAAVNTSALNASGRLPENTIKVNVLQAERVLISSDGPFRAVSGRGARTNFEPGWIEIVPSADGLKVEGGGFTDEVRFLPGKSPLAVNGRRYRGAITVRKAGPGICVVNEIDVEEYLLGVLPVEISPAWPSEALKAQAVVSRTYVYNNIGKYSDQGFDLSSDVFSQVYRGMDVEAPETNAAVSQTKGMVLTRGDEIVRAYFHSCCGGFTEDIGEVWGSSFEHLKGGTCYYCTDSPRYNWERHILPGALRRNFESSGYAIGDVTDIKLLERTSAGRIRLMKVSHTEGELLLSGHRFRMAVGPDWIKSSMLAIDRDRDVFLFYGRGWGHGVGMCQWGARGQAKEGKNYRDILSHYFPGTQIRRF